VTELPAGWAWATLTDVIASDGVFSDGDWVETKDQDPSGEVRLTQLADIGEGVFRDRSSRFMTAESAERLGCTYLEPGDVLVARMPDPLGRACLYPGGRRPAVTAVDVCIVRPGSDSVDTRWLMWWLNTPQFRQEVGARQSGTTRKRISRKNMAAIRFPLPPVAEQQRIVAAIEEHLSRLEAADANLESGRRRIEKLRDAVRDSLVDPDWPLRPLGELLREPLRNGLSAKASPTGTTRIITLTAVTTGEFSEHNSKLADVDSSRTKGLWLEPGDVLIERSNTPELVGTAALFDGPLEWAIFPDLLIRCRPSAELFPEYLNLVLSTSTVRRYFQRAAQGISGSMPKIDQGAVLRLPVPTPPEDEQVRAVEKATAALAGCKQLEAATSVSKRQAASLRRSILARAFRGELVPQDTRDEPASVLLERITAERAASSTKKTRTRQVKTPA
jgi:type I restriction enzyme S subunit